MAKGTTSIHHPETGVDVATLQAASVLQFGAETLLMNVSLFLSVLFQLPAFIRL